MYRVLDSFDISSPPIYNITAMMSVWRIRQKISRTDLCCIVYHSCTMICTHLYEQFLSMLHSGDKVDRVADLSPILLTLSPICRKSTVTAHSTLAKMSNMFNLIDFVESGLFLSPVCRTSFRLSLVCMGPKRLGQLCRLSTKSTMSNSTLLPVRTGL